MTHTIEQVIAYAERPQSGCVCMRDASLALRSTFRIGGTARAIVFPTNEDALCELLRVLRASEVTYRVVGNCSNVVLPDGVYEGVVVFTTKLETIEKTETGIRASAGAPISRLCRMSVSLGGVGMESMYGIPGTVGGAVTMNAGAFGAETKDFLNSSTYFDPVNDRIVTLAVEEHAFDYRDSIYRHHPEWVILHADFRLLPGNTANLAGKMKEIVERRRG